MLKSEVQHQFWVTKKAVQRKLGSKEDEHIVSSDADLDSKIALLKSISETCTNLNKIIDQYQERLCVLSQEECTFGRFLKEIGKRSKTTGSSITNSGKAIYYCGQQRMSVRVPLLRFQHEVDVFRFRAVGDSLDTLNCMEKERTEYRAALCWMKSLSTRLDPDNDRGLDKFRRAQSHVRVAKENFDKLSMDCIQKIDLLAAARCNMFSHGLVAYMSAIVQFSKKSASTFQTVSSSLILNPLYDFCVLKDLSLNNQCGVNISKIQTTDGDQSMLFSDDFQDYNDNEETKKNEDDKVLVDNNLLIRLPEKVGEIKGSNNRIDDSAILSAWCKEANIQSLFSDAQNLQPQINKENKIVSCEAIKKSPFSEGHAKKEVRNWFDLFADLDPLENIDSFDLKMNEKLNIQKT